MAKDWVGGNAAVFKTLGASNHENEGDRQREDYYATEPAATEWLCKIEDFGGVKSSNHLAVRDISVRFC